MRRDLLVSLQRLWTTSAAQAAEPTTVAVWAVPSGMWTKWQDGNAKSRRRARRKHLPSRQRELSRQKKEVCQKVRDEMLEAMPGLWVREP